MKILLLFFALIAHAGPAKDDCKDLFAQAVKQAAAADAARGSEEEYNLWLKLQGEQPSEGNRANFNTWWKSMSTMGSVDGIRLATPEFIRTFDKLSLTQAAFDTKLKNFYGTKLLHRGMALQAVPSKEELLEHFVRTNDSTVGMGLDAENKPSVYSAVFKKFNDRLVNEPERFAKVVKDHIAANDGYWESKFASFTTSRAVSKEFEMGALLPLKDRKNTVSMLEVTTRERKVAAVGTATGDQTAAFGAFGGWDAEKELLIAGGADPESMTRVKLTLVKVTNAGGTEDGHMIEAYLTRKIITLERTAFNKIKYTEKMPGKDPKTEIYEIQPDRTLTKIK